MKTYKITIRCADTPAQYYDLHLLEGNTVCRVHTSKNEHYIRNLVNDWVTNWANLCKKPCLTFYR